MSTMNTVSLFTTFAPFRRRAPNHRRCAVVTREKRLLILDADGDDTAHDIQVSIPIVWGLGRTNIETLGNKPVCYIQG